MDTRESPPRFRPLAALFTGSALGLIALWGDLAGRLVLAALDGVAGFDFALLSYFGFASVLLAIVGAPIGAVLVYGLRRMAPGLGWPRPVAAAVLSLPAWAVQLFFLWQGTQPLAGFLIACVAAYAVALLFCRMIQRGNKLVALTPVALLLLFFGAGQAHSVASRREPAVDVLPGPVARPEAPDLLLVTLDTTRADHLGCYGHDEARTPHLDALAASGVLYERAFAPNPSTQPSHASLLTGLQLPWHGMRINGTAALDQGAAPVAKLMSEAGYETRAVLASFVLDRQFGLSRGFSRYDDFVPTAFGPAGVQRRMMRTVLRPSLGMQVARLLGLVELFPHEIARNAGQVTDAALALMQDAPADRPLFLWVHYWDPHAPYDPPERFIEPWVAEADAPADGYEYWFGTLSSRAEIRARYDGEIAYVDSEIVRLFDAFRERGRPAVIAVTADHGEGLQEHGVSTHGAELYDVTLHVPLILAGDGVPAGRRVADAVANYDLAPTLLGLAGVAAPEGMAARSLAPFDESAPACAPERSFYHECLKALLSGWRAAGWKLIVGEHAVELYEVAADPAEASDRAEDAPDRRATLQRTLEAAQAAFPSDRGVPIAADGELAAKLAELGYADDEP